MTASFLCWSWSKWPVQLLSIASLHRSSGGDTMQPSTKARLGLPEIFVALLVVIAVAGPRTASAQPKARAFFAFGNSYADTGNREKNASVFRLPYGITWPGYPTGRFSNGHIQTDYLAEAMGMPTPTPFVDSAVQSIASGVNFAVGGAGVLFAYGLPPLGSQVDSFELLLRSGVYTPAALAASVAFISIEGNDYSSNDTSEELTVLIQQVVEGISLAVGRLYDLGLRKVVVANIAPVGCAPSVTVLVGYSACDTSLEPLTAFHNQLLQEAIASLNALPSADFIILDENKAFNYLLNNSAKYGVTEVLPPCCRPLVPSATVFCGDHDLAGKPLYSVCDDPTQHVYWDSSHPVESTWKTVVDLFLNKPGFVIGAPTLATWLREPSVNPALPPEYAPPPGTFIISGAGGQLMIAYEALISESDYSESLGLLQAINLEENLVNYPEQVVTAFLPSNQAYLTVDPGVVHLIYARDQEFSLIEYHVVNGYFDEATLAATPSQTLTTISELQLPVNSSAVAGVSVGPAMVVRPDLYKVEGQVVVHGIDHVFIPPALQGM